MATVISQPEERTILYDVSWETYESLLADHEDRSSPRFTYDRGVLEITSPSAEHEELNDTFKLLVYVLAEGMDLEVRGFGSTTFRRRGMKRGFEPDSSFYIQSLERISGKTKLDLRFDPPPDLVIEIDITSPSLDKLPTFAAIGVPEVWRYDGSRLTIYRLEKKAYVTSAESVALAGVSSLTLSRFVEDSKAMKRTAWLRSVREWARQQK